jgi:hypothetical protein
MSVYLPNPEVKPTGAEVAEYIDTLPPEFEAVTTPPPPPPPSPASGEAVGPDEDDARDADPDAGPGPGDGSEPGA